MSDNLPDLELGVAAADFDARPMLVGRVGKEQVLIVKRDEEYFAVAALCTHYHGHLVDGLLVDDSIRCPWQVASPCRYAAGIRRHRRWRCSRPGRSVETSSHWL